MSTYINPFVVSGKIPEAYFCDRVEESDKPVDSLTGADNGVLFLFLILLNWLQRRWPNLKKLESNIY